MAFSSFYFTIFTYFSLTFCEVDKAMQIWTSQAIANKLPLSNMILQQKGLEFAKMFNMENKLKCANGWMYRLKNEMESIKLSYQEKLTVHLLKVFQKNMHTYVHF